MPDSTDIEIGRVQPVGDAAPVQPVRNDPVLRKAVEGNAPKAPREPDVAAATGGNLPGAYAQFFINDSNEVVIRVHDAATNRVIDEFPSEQIQAMASYMKQYEETAARKRTALLSYKGAAV